MLDNWAKITNASNTEYVVVTSTALAKVDLVSAIIYNGHTADNNLYLTLHDSNGNLKAILLNTKWKPLETVFLEQFKVFLKAGETIRATSAFPDMSILLNGKV